MFLPLDLCAFPLPSVVPISGRLPFSFIHSVFISLAAEYADQPAALLETYAASAAHPVAAAGETFARFNDFVISQIDRLLTPLLRRQVSRLKRRANLCCI